jgi:hypothetical protein
LGKEIRHMVADLSWFNENEYDMPGEFTPLPQGKYLCVLMSSEEKDTKAKAAGKAKKGTMLVLKFQVIEGEYKGRQLFDRLNILNDNADAERISRSALKALCKAVGVPSPNNSADLHNLPLLCQVAVTKRADTGDNTNEIRGYFSRKEQQGESAEATEDAAPWER